jgi:hypothetical protein
MNPLTAFQKTLREIRELDPHPHFVESWKSFVWKTTDGVSSFLHRIVPNGSGTRLVPQVDAAALNQCWEHLSDLKFVDSVQMLARMQGWPLDEDEPEKDPVDLERLTARIRAQFASGVVAYLANRTLQGDVSAWSALCDWVGRASRGRIAPGYPAPTWSRGTTEVDVVQHALLGLHALPSLYLSKNDTMQRIGARLSAPRWATGLRAPLLG